MVDHDSNGSPIRAAKAAGSLEMKVESLTVGWLASRHAHGIDLLGIRL